jgi:hypothetical protein
MKGGRGWDSTAQIECDPFCMAFAAFTYKIIWIKKTVADRIISVKAIFSSNAFIYDLGVDI